MYCDGVCRRKAQKSRQTARKEARLAKYNAEYRRLLAAWERRSDGTSPATASVQRQNGEDPHGN